MLLGQVSDALRPLNNDEFTERVTEAVKVFLKNRGTLTITISPERPVPVAQVAAGIMQAPQALPDLLGIGVETGQ